MTTHPFPELNDELRWILGMPCFHCAKFAPALRLSGLQIREKAEDEQAVVIHWMLRLYFEHGENWRDVAESILRAIDKNLKPKREEPAP